MRVGLDVGGTKTDAVIVDDSATILARLRLSTGWGPDGVTRTITDAVHRLAAEAEIDRRLIRSVGIGIPGQIDPSGTCVAHAVNLGVETLDLADALEPVLGIPVRAENDVKAAALGAFAIDGRRGSIAYLNLGTGVAAGIVVDGRLWRGPRGAAGEVGHVSVDPRGPLCACGQRGCIEAFAGGGSIARRWGRPGGFPVRDVFDAADVGDPAARELRVGLAYSVASAVRVLVLTVDVDVVVLGGGVTAIGDRLLSDVADHLVASAVASPFMTSLRLHERIELLPVDSPAAALGAALVGRAHSVEEALSRG